MATDPEVTAVGPFGDDGVVVAGSRAFRLLRPAVRLDSLRVAGVPADALGMTSSLRMAVIRLGHYFRELIPGSLPSRTSLALVRAWVAKTAANAADTTLAAHWEARGVDLTLVLHSGATPTTAQLEAVRDLALDPKVRFGFAEVRTETFGAQTRTVLHASVAREPDGRLTEPIPLGGRVPDLPEFDPPQPSALRDGPVGPVASNLLRPYRDQGSTGTHPLMTREVELRLIEVNTQAKLEWGRGAFIRIERAWVPFVLGTTPTLFHEGRAAAITLRVQAPSLPAPADAIDRLARLAVHAGFPYVEHRPAGDGLPEHIYVSANDNRILWARETPQAEAHFWDDYAGRSEQYLDFWVDFLGLTQGTPTKVAIDATTRARLLALIRAVAWQESKHGTTDAGLNKPKPTEPFFRSWTHPQRSLMQCAHPGDALWKAFSRANNLTETFQTAAGRAEIWELPALAAIHPGFPDEADLGRLCDPMRGQSDQNFDQPMSLFWGTLFLIHKVNARLRHADRATNWCADGSWTHFLGGAAEYNAAPPVKLETKYYHENIAKFVLEYQIAAPGLPTPMGGQRPDHLLVSRAGVPLGLSYFAWDLAKHHQRRSKFGGQFRTDPLRRPSAVFAAPAGSRVVALTAGQVGFDPVGHRLTLEFPYIGGSWRLHYDGVARSLVPDGTAVVAGQAIGVVQDRGKNSDGRPLSRVGLGLEPVVSPPATDLLRLDVMDPVVAAGWVGRVAFDDSDWNPK